MHVPINVKSPNNISEWQMGFNSACKRLKLKNRNPKCTVRYDLYELTRSLLKCFMVDDN
jgi:hypothetical protein